jgi:hypothetical protein
MPASVENDLAEKSRRIRDLNDAFRKSLDSALGTTMLTAGVSALPSDVRAMAIRKVATFDAFGADNDPHGEHDFGSFDLAGHKFFFKIDYYDSTLESGRPRDDDPRADAHARRRILRLDKLDRAPQAAGNPAAFFLAPIRHLRRPLLTL